MKSVINQLFVLFFMLNAGILFPAFCQESCTIELSASIQHCTCINNGEIIFNLTKSALCDIDTDNIRYSLFSPANSISSVNNISPVFNNLPPGEYTGIVSALHNTGGIGIGANIILNDTLVLTLGSSYTEPTAGILNNEFTLTHPFGKVRSWPCKATGIVQMKINGGKKPYTIQVRKLEGGAYVPYKTSLFENEQHHGTDPAKMDYHEYYDIDSLSAGQYRLVFTDACGYTLPPYDVNVEAIDIESSGNLATDACNDNGNNVNSFYINDFSLSGALNYFAQNADYYALKQKDSGEIHWKYRWIDPGINGLSADTSEWSVFQFGRLSHQVAAAEKYCDLWGQQTKLQVLDINCHNSKEYIVNFKKPLSNFRFYERSINYPELSYTYTDSCGKHNFAATKTQYDYEFYPSKEFHSLFTANNAGSRGIRYYITDTEVDTLIYHGITGLYLGRELSYCQIFEFDSIYHGKTANFKVLDAQNCTLANRNLTVSSKITGTITNPSFSYYGMVDTADFCAPSKFTMYFTFQLGPSDSDTLQITDSPGQLSDISMVYRADSHQWVRLDSNTNITLGNHFGDLAINGMRSSGTFRYRYVSGCYVTEKSMTKGSNNMGIGYYFTPKPPKYKTEPTCTGIQIIPTHGSYQQHGFKDYTNEPFVNNVKAVFKLYGNPSTPDIVTGYYRVGDTINLSIEGDIRIEMCDEYNYSNPEHLCHFRDTVIHCGKPILQYDYFYSYCCQISDTASTVRTRAKGGVPPYLYIISDKNGNILDSNQVGDFFSVPLLHHDTVLLKVIDQCGTNFIYKGQVIEARLIKKAWFDNGDKIKILSDSSLCELFAITLDSIQYQWHGPDSFYSEEQNPSFFIPKDSNMSGKYYLSLQDPVCGILQDSLTLKVLTAGYIPELIWIDDTICSGKSYNEHGFSIYSSPIDTLRILYDTLISITNDSTFLKLTILPVYHSPHIDSIVTALEEYLYGPVLLTDTGLYEISLHTDCNCDSVIYVHLMFTKYLPCPDAIDYNGFHYPAVRINKYCWTTENLKSTHYSDGRSIAPLYEYKAPEYPDNALNVSIFGRLYDWFAVMDTGKHTPPDLHGNIQGICPDGWLLPTPEDFAELSCYTVKELRSPLYWLYNPGTNESGFTSLPAGYYDAMQQRYNNLLGYTYYWCCSPPALSNWIFKIYQDCQMLQETGNACNGYSVRCIQK